MINVEDMLPVDGGKAIVAGSYKDASAGFYLIDTTAKTAKVVTLSVAAKPDPLYSDCPGAPDLTKLSTHGLDVRGRGSNVTVYAINHGGRESVEVFNLDARKGTAEWVGCVVAPEGTSANSVVGLPDKSIVFTKLYDTKTRGNGISPILQGQITGPRQGDQPGAGHRAFRRQRPGGHAPTARRCSSTPTAPGKSGACRWTAGRRRPAPRWGSIPTTCAGAGRGHLRHRPVPAPRQPERAQRLGRRQARPQDHVREGDPVGAGNEGIRQRPPPRSRSAIRCGSAPSRATASAT
ncbi:MAG: hypothetical protein WDN45_00760 [Caulobacteraceae bacterium]